MKPASCFRDLASFSNRQKRLQQNRRYEARIPLHALPQVLLPGGIFVQNSGLGSPPAMENGAEKLRLAFGMAEMGGFVATTSSSELARRSALNPDPVQRPARCTPQWLA